MVPIGYEGVPPGPEGEPKALKCRPSGLKSQSKELKGPMSGPEIVSGGIETGAEADERRPSPVERAWQGPEGKDAEPEGGTSGPGRTISGFEGPSWGLTRP